MLEVPPRKTRHYEPVDGLVRRTESDVSPAFVAARARAEPLVETLKAPRPAHPRLVGSAEGPIDRMLLTIPDYAVRAAVLADAYRHLLQQLSSQVSLVVLTHESVQEDVRGWLRGCGRLGSAAVIAAPDHLHFSIWAEDGYVAITDGDDGVTYLLEPFSFPRYGDSLIADFVANATDIRNTQAPLYFQGGNLLIGDGFVLLGLDYPAETLAYVDQGILRPGPSESPEALIRRLYGDYLDAERDIVYVGSTVPVPEMQQRGFHLDGEEWTEILYLGNKPGTAQPLFHIDMFVSLAGRGSDGRYRVLVGDPRLAADILDAPLYPHAMADIFDNIARSLGQQGFAVARNPLPLVYVDDEPARRRLWYFATANNALVESRPDRGPTVYLPTYGHGAWTALTATDEANREIWEGLGYAAVLLTDFHPFAENLGAVHCITKYLARAEPRATPSSVEPGTGPAAGP
jgi:hypothetical protein